MLITENDIIPFGVEIIEYSNKQIINTSFSALPTSVHTIRNAVIILPVQEISSNLPNQKNESILQIIQKQFNFLSMGYLYKEIDRELFFKCLVNLFGEKGAIIYQKKVDSVSVDLITGIPTLPKFNLQDVLDKTDECGMLFKLLKKESNLSNDYYTIPPNITSLSFSKRLDYLNNNENDKEYKFKIPNTIKELTFENSSYDVIGSGKGMIKGDIPEGVTSLSVYSNFTWFDHMSERILPNSINCLYISGFLTYSTYFNFIIGSNIESLTIGSQFDMGVSILKNSNLYQCNSIKKLMVSNVSKIESNSLPSSITELKLSNICKMCIFQINSIPNSVTCLDLSDNCSSVDLPPILIPKSVTNLILPQRINKNNK